MYLPVTFILFGLTRTGYFDQGLFFEASVCQLLGVLVGANAGAWAYKEG
jgi:hypothetical protein